MNRVYDFIEDVANYFLDFFFKFKRPCLIIFMWMCIICTAITFNIFTGFLAFFVFFYLKRTKGENHNRKKFEIMRTK